MKKILIFTLLFFPAFASAEELLPALCQQVINPAPNTSLTQIIGNHIVEKLKTVPSEMAQDAQELANEAAESLASALEKRKPSLAAGVLGASDVYVPTWWEAIYEYVLGAFAFVVRHWVWALGAVMILIVGYSFRP